MPSPRVPFVLCVTVLACGEAAPPGALGVDAEPRVAVDAGAPAADATADAALDATVVVDASAPDAAALDAAPDAAPDATPDAVVRDAAAPDATAPDAAVDPCSAEALLAERAGFGRSVTGGDPSRLYHVTTLSAGTSGSGATGSLRRALESSEPWWIVFDVDGTITFEDSIDVESNKTIDGRGRDVTLRGSLRIREAENVIINDVKLTNDLAPACEQSGDVVTASGPGGPDPSDFVTRGLWLHHVELFEGGDGLLDLRGATEVTVSWSHFHSHKKGSLMWKDSDDAPTAGMFVTMHHNFFERISLRGPQFLFGKLHFVNNLHFEWFYYGAGCLGDAECLSEANVFQPRARCVYCQDPSPCGDWEWFPDFTQAFVHEWASNGLGRLRSTGDLLLDGAEVAEREPAMVFDPAVHYAFTAEPATMSLADDLRMNTGPRTLVCPR